MPVHPFDDELDDDVVWFHFCAGSGRWNCWWFWILPLNAKWFLCCSYNSNYWKNTVFFNFGGFTRQVDPKIGASGLTFKGAYAPDITVFDTKHDTWKPGGKLVSLFFEQWKFYLTSDWLPGFPTWKRIVSP